MKNPVLAKFESLFMRAKPLPVFAAGDTVSVYVKISEGNDKEGKPKFRLQAFEGIVIRFRKGTTNSTFMVRKIGAGGISIERNFYSHSPLVDHVDVIARGRVRRSRIYYLRDLKGKAARITTRLVKVSATSAAAK